MNTKTATVEIDGFDNRGTEHYPFGFLDFTDGTRIGFSGFGDIEGADEDGLFEAQQPYLTGAAGRKPKAAHCELARAWSRALRAEVAKMPQPWETGDDEVAADTETTDEN